MSPKSLQSKSRSCRLDDFAHAIVTMAMANQKDEDNKEPMHRSLAALIIAVIEPLHSQPQRSSFSWWIFCFLFRQFTTPHCNDAFYEVRFDKISDNSTGYCVRILFWLCFGCVLIVFWLCSERVLRERRFLTFLN
jgi:hypothetical protein